MTADLLRRCFACVCIAATIVAVSQSYGLSDAKTPAEVKTGYVVNLARFVKWPKRAFSTEQTPIRIGVIADEATKQLLEERTKGQKAHKRSLTVEMVPLGAAGAPEADELRKYHIIYLGSQSAASVKPVLIGVSGHPVLTISEIPEFAVRGGAIELFQSGDRIAFRVNRSVIQGAGLRAHSKMLKLAEIVETDPSKAVVPTASSGESKDDQSASSGSAETKHVSAQPAEARPQSSGGVQSAGIVPPLRPDWAESEAKQPTNRPTSQPRDVVPMTRIRPLPTTRPQHQQDSKGDGGGS